MRYIAPSDHVRRDLQFASTFELFKKADARSNREREMHPEFIDSPMFHDRASVLLSGRLVPRFLLGGGHLAVRDRVCATLVGGRALRGIFVKRAFFAAARSGLARNLATLLLIVTTSLASPRVADTLFLGTGVPHPCRL